MSNPNYGNELPPYGYQNKPQENTSHAYGAPQRSQNLSDAENGKGPYTSNSWGEFSGLVTKDDRIKFIRKVYGIITVQLLFTFGIVCIFVFVDSVKEFARTNTGISFYLASYIIFVVLLIIMSCFGRTGALRKYPTNYIMLSLITICMTYMLGMISSYHEVQAVLIAIGITFFISVGVTIFAMQTKYDFTNCWMVMLFLVLALFGFGICVAITAPYGNYYIMQAVYGGLGAIVMALFLAIDTQLIIGGKKQYQFSQEDYVFAALQIYLDICNMFLYILALVGAKK
jgi:protein lifeguard